MTNFMQNLIAEFQSFGVFLAEFWSKIYRNTDSLVLLRHFKEHRPKRDQSKQQIKTQSQLLVCVQFFQLGLVAISCICLRLGMLLYIKLCQCE